METLTKLFGSAARVKLMRLFIFNENQTFEVETIIERTKSATKSAKAECRKELNNLVNAELIKKRDFTKEVHKSVGSKRNAKIVVNKVKATGYTLDVNFPYLAAMKNLLTIASLGIDNDLKKRLMTVGRMKLILVAGLFIQDWESRVDLLLVGDDIQPAKADQLIQTIESELGKEITYTALETSEFEYRLNIHDKLIRDILDYPHKVLVDKIGLTSE